MASDQLHNVRTGMRVLDSSNAEIGTVAWVRLGDDDPATPELEATTVDAGTPGGAPDSPLGRIAAAFRSDDLPEEMRERLLLHGFVRIDIDGPFNADRYVTPDQIAAVTGDRLVLRASKDDLLPRP